MSSEWLDAIVDIERVGRFCWHVVVSTSYNDRISGFALTRRSARRMARRMAVRLIRRHEWRQQAESYTAAAAYGRRPRGGGWFGRRPIIQSADGAPWSAAARQPAGPATLPPGPAGNPKTDAAVIGLPPPHQAPTGSPTRTPPDPDVGAASRSGPP